MNNFSVITATALLLALTALATAGAESGDSIARKLINSQGCKACHALEGNGGIVAASFEEIRGRLTRSEIRSQLVNDKGRHGDGTIPDFDHLTEQEIEALVNFIQPRSPR